MDELLSLFVLFFFFFFKGSPLLIVDILLVYCFVDVCFVDVDVFKDLPEDIFLF